MPSRRLDCVNGFPRFKTFAQVSSMMNDPDAASYAVENIEHVRAMILNNRRVTTNEEAHYIHISQGYFHEIIHKGLGFHSVSARWLPKRRTTKTQPLDSQPKRIGSLSPWIWGFLRRIVTGDDMWFHNYEPEGNDQNVEWKCQALLVKKQFKTHLSVREVMLTRSRDSSDQFWNTTHNSQNVRCYMLRDRLRPTLLTRSWEMLTTAVTELQDDSRPHTAVQTVDTLRQLNCDVLKFLLYSSDLASSDCQVFGPLEELSEDANIPAINSWKKWCTHDLLANQKHFFYGYTETCVPMSNGRWK